MIRLRSFVFGPAIALVSLACDAQPSPSGASASAPASSALAPSAQATSAQATSAPSPAASASAASSPVLPPVELPAGEPALVEALGALSSCDGLKITETCAALEAWEKRIEAVDAVDDETPAGKAERARHATSCLASLRHASPAAREAAADCVEDYQAQLGDRKLAARALLAQIPVEASSGARSRQIAALERLDPTEHGLVPEVIALARQLVGKREARSELEGLVEATRSPNFRLELRPTPEAVAFAVELVRRREADGKAIDVLTEAKELSSEACEALLELASTKRGEWSDAVQALLWEAKRCEAQRERVVELLLEVARAPRSPKEGHGLVAVASQLATIAEDGGLSAEQKARLGAAAEAALKEAPKQDEREQLEQLRKALKGR